MGFFDRLFGRADDAPSAPPAGARDAGRGTGTEDAAERALERYRYRYLLRTAPPESIEQAHAEAFAQLSPEQRRQVLEGLGRELPPGERIDRADPDSLARMATRAEMRRPGTLERSFGSMPAMGGAGFIGVNLLSTIAGVSVGNALFDAFFGDFGDFGDFGGGFGGE